jgi:hypothetical protein
VREDDWNEAYRKLAAFKDREGHSRVPQKHWEDGIKLGSWVSDQRKSKHSLSSEKSQMLEELGFVWDAFADAWEQWFELLQGFHAREGHCNVPQHHRESGRKLGLWVSNQRVQKEKLSDERRARLDAIGFVWSVK